MDPNSDSDDTSTNHKKIDLPPQSIRILTQNMNIHYFVPHSYTGREERVAGLLPHLEDFDILAFQELFTVHVMGGLLGSLGRARDQVVKKWKSLGNNQFSYVSEAPRSWLPAKQDTGCLMLTRHKIVSKRTLFFENLSSSELPSAKGAVMVQIEVPWSDKESKPDEEVEIEDGIRIPKQEKSLLTIVTAHMDAHSREIRELGFKQIARHLIKPILKQDSNAHIIMCGDLNTVYNTSAYHEMIKILQLNDLIYSKDTQDSDIFTHESGVILDYILGRNVSVVPESSNIHWWSSIPHQQPELTISDHAGVSVGIQLTQIA